MSETEIKAAGKRDRLIAFFDTIVIPTEPIKVDRSTTILDPVKAVSVSIERLKHSKILSDVFKAAYMNLYHLKKYINERNSTDNSQRPNL